MDGKQIYMIRAEYAGGVYPGEILSGNGAAWFGYNGTTMSTEGDVQCLAGNSNACRWVAVSGPCTVDKLGAEPVEGGWEPDGTRYLIAQVSLARGTHCGKVKWNGIASIACDSGEHSYENYNVLVFT